MKFPLKSTWKLMVIRSWVTEFFFVIWYFCHITHSTNMHIECECFDMYEFALFTSIVSTSQLSISTSVIHFCGIYATNPAGWAWLVLKLEYSFTLFLLALNVHCCANSALTPSPLKTVVHCQVWNKSGWFCWFPLPLFALSPACAHLL